MFPVEIIKSEEGFAVSCPALRGCWSQGATREEALENIRAAIALWLEVSAEEAEQRLRADGIVFDRDFVTA